MTQSYVTDGVCTLNAFGGAIVGGTIRTQMQTSLSNAVASGATSILFSMHDIDDLTGTSDPSMSVGVLGSTPRTPPQGVTYDGTSDLDWWHEISKALLHDNRVPNDLLTANISATALSAGPGTANVSLDLAGQPAQLKMYPARISATTGASSTPLSNTDSTPRGHLTSENLDPALVTFASTSAGRFCGNISARSFSTAPIPTSLIGCSSFNCSRCYTSANTWLDLIVGGCTVLGIQQVKPTQPDTSTTGSSYSFTTNATTKAVTACQINNVNASLSDCLDQATFSSFYQFTTNRVIPRGCPDTPVAANNGPVCSGSPLSLTATGPANGTYAWTGPNGFTSSAQNPTIPSVELAAAGTYSVTVTVAGCTSAAGTTSVSVKSTPAAPTISAPSSAQPGQSGLTASIAPLAQATYAWTIENGTITGGQGTTQITFTAGTQNSVGLSATRTVDGCTSPAGTASVPIAGPAIPSNVVATGSNGSVTISWNAASGAATYEVRRLAAGGAMATFGQTASLQIVDSTAVSDAAYLYSVQSIASDGGRSAFSAGDLATTFVFTDDPVAAASTVVKAVHVTQLRSAVNAVRGVAALPAFTFTDATITTGLTVKAVHFSELRSALATARSTLGLSTITFTDATLTTGSTAVKAAHINELRSGVK
jgi:fibronectin type 3 domain-containing protein